MFGIHYVIVREYETGLLYENGRFLRALEPGRYRVVDWPWRREEIVRVDVRRATLQLSGQEMLTSDGLSVRLNVVADYRIVDAAQGSTPPSTRAGRSTPRSRSSYARKSRPGRSTRSWETGARCLRCCGSAVRRRPGSWAWNCFPRA